MLKVENISCGYGSHLIWSEVTLEARKGEIHCLVGPNGTGKTTLLKCILGLLPVQQGQVLIENQSVLTLPVKERAKLLAYVPQAETTVFPHTVEEMVAMGRSPYVGIMGRLGPNDWAAVHEALEQMGIAHLRHCRYSELSGGQQQLTLLARALAQQSEYLLLDEPAANLDYGNQIKLLTHLDGLAEQGYGIIMTSHFPEHALLVADYVWALKDGRLREKRTRFEITGEFLSELYDTSVSVSEIWSENKKVRLCVPLFERKK